MFVKGVVILSKVLSSKKGKKLKFVKSYVGGVMTYKRWIIYCFCSFCFGGAVWFFLLFWSNSNSRLS